MAKRTAFTDSTEKHRVLLCAFAQVPGSSSLGVRGEQLLLGFSSGLDIDALTIKSENLNHIERVSEARMLRVPIADEGSPGPTHASAAFKERLRVFSRALARQLDTQSYDVVICLDLFSAGAAAPLLGRGKLVIEVVDVPSLSFDKRWPVLPDDDETKKQWEAKERAAWRAAKLVLIASRHAARMLSSRCDPLTLRVAPRLVDTHRFKPPSMALDLDDAKTVAFLGGREGKAGSAVVVATAIQSLLAKVPAARVLVVGAPVGQDARLIYELSQRGVRERVVMVDVNSAVDLTQTLCIADVVVVVAGADGEPYALPHRALETMACGRPLVVTGTDAAYKDVITPSKHARVVAADGDDVAVAVATLLADDHTREVLARNGLKQAQAYDLRDNLGALGRILTDATGLPFIAKFDPRPKDTLAPATLAPEVRASKRSPGMLAGASQAQAPLKEEAQLLKTAPRAAPVALVSSAPATPERAPPPRGYSGAPVPPGTRDRTTRTILRDDKTAAGDVWAGDTRLDPLALPGLPSEPAPELVRGAMLITQSGSAPRKNASSPFSRTEASQAGSSPQPDAARPDAARPDAARPDAARPDAARPDAARPDAATAEAATAEAATADAATADAATADAARPGCAPPDTARSGPGGHRFVHLALANSDDRNDDDWSRDTIADASPLDPTRNLGHGQSVAPSHRQPTQRVTERLTQGSADGEPPTSSSED